MAGEVNGQCNETNLVRQQGGKQTFEQSERVEVRIEARV